MPTALTSSTSSSRPKSSILNTPLRSNPKNRDQNGFGGLMKEVINKRIEGNLATYNHRISKLYKSKECTRSKKLLDEMVSKGLKPNSTSYNTITDGFYRIGDLELAKKVLDKMLSDGFPMQLTLLVDALPMSCSLVQRNGANESCYESRAYLYQHQTAAAAQASHNSHIGMPDATMNNLVDSSPGHLNP
ncbi:hypothetical protein PVK06_023789 [Gossypium arboreum]|uniref:Pentatricopeptide repeat-containing protein n=1 Tax=Gossypium arboreum TaxID=29729 RepID=A0ABR0PCB6_GOSAR|nr:hypothetical protein PVK06_023789 [Gossypium arboreum]